ncbi:MAG: histidine phosphatase family protein [Clostridiales bacterium]|nr:histidine phosphatase family protein [Clostridiales bacterium]
MSRRKTRVIQSCVVILFCAALFYGALRQDRGVLVYFVRHGQTDTNVAGLLVGTSGNPVLTETGVEMAQTLGESLEDVTFDAAYSSSLQRAYDTAVFVLESSGQGELEVIQDDGLRDISWGEAEGMTSEELYEYFGLTSVEECFGTVEDADFVSPINAETEYEFCNRFEDAVERIVDEAEDGDTILIVAHSSMDFYFQRYFPEQAGGGVNNCSVTVIRYEDGALTLLDYNDTSYLQ